MLGLALNITAAFLAPFCSSCTLPPTSSDDTQWQLRYKLQRQTSSYYDLKITAGVVSFTGVVLAAAGMCVLNPGINRLAAGVFFIEMALSIACWSIAAAWGMGPGGAVMVAVSVTALANIALSLIAARKTTEEVASGDFGTGAYEPAYEPTPRQPSPPSKAFPAAALPQGGA